MPDWAKIERTPFGTSVVLGCQVRGGKDDGKTTVYKLATLTRIGWLLFAHKLIRRHELTPILPAVVPNPGHLFMPIKLVRVVGCRTCNGRTPKDVAQEIEAKKQNAGAR